MPSNKKKARAKKKKSASQQILAVQNKPLEAPSPQTSARNGRYAKYKQHTNFVKEWCEISSNFVWNTSS
jgi:hypothetical protein